MTSNLDFEQLYEYEKHQNLLAMGHLGYTEQPPAKAGGLAITTKVGIRVKDPFSSPF